jgi:hypothetical protein
MPKATTQQPAYTAKDTGVDTASKQVIYWDPQTQSYKAAPYSWDNWSRGTHEQSKYGWYTNSQGDRVYGLRPPTLHNVDSKGEEVMHEGSDPNWKPQVTPDYNGMGTNGGQRTPTNTTGGSVPAWGGSASHDPAGNVVPGGTADPGVWGPGGTKHWTPGQTNWDWSKVGGGTGTQGMDPNSTVTGPMTEYPGQESPWGQPGRPGGNKEFYASQFNTLLNQRKLFNQASLAAGLRAKAAADNPQPTGPTDWSWANGGKGLPGVETAGGTADNPTQYSLKDWVHPGQTTNGEIMRQAINSGVLSMEGRPNVDFNAGDWAGTGWSTVNNPTDLIQRALGGVTDTPWGKAQADAINWMYTQQGVGTPNGGGPTAAPGYALPIGAYK